MSKIIVHIDLNQFFVRCEEIKDPSLIGKPVAVGHDGRSGIVSTCSYEARKYGVSSGMPMFKARKLCKDLIVVPVDYYYYEEKSDEFIAFVKKYAKHIEVASIDECYVDFTEELKGNDNPEQFFKDFQAELFKVTSLRCSIGVAPTKFLAKMGSDMHKPMGLTIIRRRDIKKLLYPLKIEDMFGVGKKTAPKLHEMGISTIGDFAREANLESPELMNALGKFFYVLKDWVNGQGSDEIDEAPFDPKSISHSHTLSENTSSYDVIVDNLTALTRRLVKKLKKANKLVNTVSIVLKDASMKGDASFAVYSKSFTFSKPIDDEKVILARVIKLYEENYLDIVVRLVGVALSNLIDKKDMAIQMTLFDYEEHIEESQTKLLINELNRRLKKPLLKRASEVNNED